MIVRTRWRLNHPSSLGALGPVIHSNHRTQLQMLYLARRPGNLRMFSASFLTRPLAFALLLPLFSLAFQNPVNVEPRSRVPAAANDPPRADLRIDVPLVLIPVHVTNAAGASVTNLTRERFRLFEDGREQSIAHFSSEEAALSIGLLLDSSSSMRSKMRKSLLAISTFFKTANERDEFFLIE